MVFDLLQKAVLCKKTRFLKVIHIFACTVAPHFFFELYSIVLSKLLIYDNKIIFFVYTVRV